MFSEVNHTFFAVIVTEPYCSLSLQELLGPWELEEDLHWGQNCAGLNLRYSISERDFSDHLLIFSLL